MYNDLIDQISKYMGEGEEFAVAQVICREAPSSGKPGDKAIILKDGTMIGWIGGGCVKGIAVKEAQEAIRENKSRLVRIDPDARFGTKSQGQGHETTYAQIIAEELGIPAENIQVEEGDTDTAPYGLGTYASRSTPTAGAAAAMAEIGRAHV